MSQLEYEQLKRIAQVTERTNELLQQLIELQQPKGRTEVVSDKQTNPRGRRNGNQK